MIDPVTTWFEKLIKTTKELHQSRTYMKLLGCLDILEQ